MDVNKKIKKIQVIYNPNTKEYEKAFVTINGKTKVLTNADEIKNNLKKFQMQEGKAIKELGVDKLEVVFSTNPVAKDKEEAWANAARIVNSKINKSNPYENKSAKDMPKKNSKWKKTLLTGGILVGIALAVTSCGLKDKIANMFNKNAKSVSEEAEEELRTQLTDKDILSKDFDYYADNYEYSIQQEVAFTANAFLEQANTNIKNMGLKTEDGKDITGLFTEEEAWVYAITINNLRVDQVLEIYSDSKFDYSKFEDTKQMMITKMMQYQMLVGFGKVEQLDFTKEFMTPHDDFVKSVFDNIATYIEEIGKNIDNKTVAKEKIKELHDYLKEIADSGNLSQNVQDMLGFMIAPTYYAGVLTESSYGKLTYFTEEFGEDLVGKGLCIDKSTGETKENKQHVQAQFDASMADAAENSNDVQKMNNKDYTESLNNKNSYIYWMNEALQKLANEASREDKYLYAIRTIENIYDLHTNAEELLKDYLVSERGFEVGTNDYAQAFNNIVTDGQDRVLAVETILSLISDNALVKGYTAQIEGYTIEGSQNQLLKIVNKEIENIHKKYLGLSNGSGSTDLPKNMKQFLNKSRYEAISEYGEDAVKAAEKTAFDNDASKAEAEKKAEDVKEKAQDNLDKGNYGEFKGNAGKHDQKNKDKYEENAEEAIKNKEESDKITSQGQSGKENIDKNLGGMVNKGDGFIEADKDKKPEGDVYEGDPGKIEWSNGETLGGNADKTVTENVADPTASIQNETPKQEQTPETPKEETKEPEQNNNSGSVSGGETDLYLPEDMFEPVAANYSLKSAAPTVTEAPSEPTPVEEAPEVENTNSGSVSGGETELYISEDMFEPVAKKDYAALMQQAINEHVEALSNPVESEEARTYQKTYKN